jgi:hypothetical protein
MTHGSLKSGRKNEKLVNSGNERSPEHFYENGEGRGKRERGARR